MNSNSGRKNSTRFQVKRLSGSLNSLNNIQLEKHLLEADENDNAQIKEDVNIDFEDEKGYTLANDNTLSGFTIQKEVLGEAYVPLTTVGRDPIAIKAAEYGRDFAKRKTKRLVFKDGNSNVTTSHVKRKRWKFIVDIFTTLVDMKWRYNICIFVSAFIITWFLFALVWFLIAYVHGDTDLENRIPDWTSCVANVYDFATALLFSIETQHTIGYGVRAMEPKCPFAVVMLMVQSCVGVFIQSLMAGLIFAKLSQPKRRAHTIMFSKRAVISKRDGQYCLLFRAGNMRKSQFIGTSIRALFVKDKFTKEGECIPLCQCPMELQTESYDHATNDYVFMVWPVTVVHKINKSSPLWDVSAVALNKQHFEIIVILEGVIESTGSTAQVRTSYLPSEILWGHRLAPLMTFQMNNGQYNINFSQFHAVIPTLSMPEISANELALKYPQPESDSEEFRYGYVSQKSSIRPDTTRLSVLRRMKGGIKFRHNKFRKETANGRKASSTPVLTA